MRYRTNIIFLTFTFLLTACASYKSPDRSTWGTYLRGATFTDMTDSARVAKRPIYQGSGGRLVSDVFAQSAAMEYGDRALNENAMYIGYMSELERVLYDTLRAPGTSVQRAGTDIVILLVRDALMELNAPEISADGDKNLGAIARYDATFIEIAGYTDSMRDKSAATALSFDMAARAAVYLARAGINPMRIFVIGRGASRPIAAQDGWGRLTNRRIEIRIVPAR